MIVVRYEVVNESGKVVEIAYPMLGDLTQQDFNELHFILSYTIFEGMQDGTIDRILLMEVYYDGDLIFDYNFSDIFLN